MYIREAKPEDAGAAAFLIQLAIQDIAEALTGEKEELAILDELSYFFRHKGNRLSYQNSLIIEADGDVAGLIIAYHGSEAEELDKPIEERLRNKAKKPMTIEKEAKLGDYYIDTLCIKPAYWGKRMGTMLVEAIEQKAMENNYHSISLNVEKDNFKARRLYAYLGYETLETIMINRHEYDYMVKTLHKGGKEYD